MRSFRSWLAELLGGVEDTLLFYRLPADPRHDEGQESKEYAVRVTSSGGLHHENGIETVVIGTAFARRRAGARASAQANQPPGYRVLIGFAPAAELQAAEDRANIIRQAGGIVYASFALIPAVSAWVPAQALKALAGRPDVAYVEEDVVLQAFEQATPWGVGRVHANLVWPGGNTGAGVDVAILDTGIDSRHPDLVVVDGVDYSDASGTPGGTDPADWNDNHGHGTHCAGIVAALNNSVGVVGVAPAPASMP